MGVPTTKPNSAGNDDGADCSEVPYVPTQIPSLREIAEDKRRQMRGGGHLAPRLLVEQVEEDRAGG